MFLGVGGAALGATAVRVVDLLQLVKLCAASEDAFAQDGKVTTGSGLVASPEGGKVLGATSSVLGVLQVRSRL